MEYQAQCDSGEENPSLMTFCNSITEMAFILFALNIGLSNMHGPAVLMGVLKHGYRPIRKVEGRGIRDYDKLYAIS